MTTSPSTPPSLAPEQLYSPPPSPVYDDRPVVATDEWGMVLEGESSESPPSRNVRAVKEKAARRKRQPIHYVSKHFAPADVLAEEQKTREGATKKLRVKKASPRETTLPSTPPETPAKTAPRIYYGLNVDELSSDSDLTDVPDPIPDPFAGDFVAVKTIRTPKTPRHPTKSPYFPTPHRARPQFLSTLPFPPISHTTFGLMQERLADQPFKLLLATIFLNKTPGERAMPVCYELLSHYPTPDDLAKAAVEDITGIIRHLGFQNQRARKIVGLAKGWVEREPARGVKYRKLNYPEKGDGRDVKEDEIVFDDDDRVAWEISHLPGLGPYSHDSWRMFCRDKLRGLATAWDGEGSVDKGFEPEWKRVLPKDKELRAWMTWMWMKEGWVWDCETGKRKRAGDELMALARGGGVVVEEHGDGKETLRLEQGFGEVKGVGKRAERPAGVILDQVKAEDQDT